MGFQVTTATRKILKLDKRLRVVAGGTSASKTVSILMSLIDYAQTTQNELISVVSETFPHLRTGAMLDFENIMRDRGYWKEESWSKTLHTYTFETGSKIEFFSADTPGKVHGPRRDVLYVNEANNIDYKIFDHMRIRTRKVIWLDFNPTVEFWYYTELAPNYEHDFLTVTYKDNEALDQATVKDIESHQFDSAWWRVYGLGLLGEVEGRIYGGWRALDSIPFEAKLVKRGLDFGYSNDPSGLIAIYEYNGGFILDEEMYSKGMSNSEIANHIKSLQNPNMLVVADSSEPKSIDELRLYGINVIGANKGPGSVTQGIQFVKSQRISYTKNSVNLAKEYRNYMWLKDKSTDKFINKPQDFLNHLLDPVRYALESYMPREEETEVQTTGNIASLWNN